MKHFIIILVTGVFLTSCNQSSNETKVESKDNGRTEVTSCVENTFILRDTNSLNRIAKDFDGLSMMSYNSANETYRTFLSEPEFQVIIQSLKKLMHNPQSFVYSEMLVEHMNSTDI